MAGFFRDWPRLERACSRALAAGLILAALAVLFLRLVTHFPFFDESVHAHVSWLVSQGLKPGADFFSTHPAFFYLVSAPLWRIFPDTTFALLGFRFLSLAIFVGSGALLFLRGGGFARHGWLFLVSWALIAVAPNTGCFLVEYSVDHLACLSALAAMLFFFDEATPAKLALSSGLALFSVLVTPKYAFPLFFGLLGYLAAFNTQGARVRESLLCLAKGGGVALAAVLAVFAAAGVSFLDNLWTVYFVTSKVSLAVENQPLWKLVIYFFTVRSPLFGLLALLSLAGWVVRAREAGWRDPATLAGGGILFGLLLFVLRVRVRYDQYQFPVYATLTLFAPFSAVLFSRWSKAAALRPLLILAALLVALSQIPAVAGEFSMTSLDRNPDRGRPYAPFFRTCATLDGLLRLIPPAETVAAVWPLHPIMRRDPTYVTIDDRPSAAQFLGTDSPLRARFSPANFARALDRKHPAMISLYGLDRNYPPGWMEVAIEYLARNRGLYTEVPFPEMGGETVHVRSDLLPPDFKQLR